MSKREFVIYFLAQLATVKDDLNEEEYKILSDITNMTNDEIYDVIIALSLVEGHSEELDWLSSLCKLSTRTYVSVNPQMN